MSNTIKITKEIPAPPEGFAVEDRQPKEGERSIILLINGQWSAENKFGYQPSYIYAYRIPKKKRLMTPQELAGKWLHFHDDTAKALVLAIGYNYVMTIAQTKSVQILHEEKTLWSDTPTSEPRSLEVDDDR